MARCASRIADAPFLLFYVGMVVYSSKLDNNSTSESTSSLFCVLATAAVGNDMCVFRAGHTPSKEYVHNVAGFQAMYCISNQAFLLQITQSY